MKCKQVHLINCVELLNDLRKLNGVHTEIGWVHKGVSAIPSTNDMADNPDCREIRGTTMFGGTIHVPRSPASSASCNSSVRNRNMPDVSGSEELM